MAEFPGLGLLTSLLGRTARRPSPYSQVGVGGVVHTGGFVQSSETNAALVGEARYKTYSEVLVNTSIVAAGTRLFLNLCSKAGWRAEPAEDGGPRAEELADRVSEILFEGTRTPWHRIVRRAAMYRNYGFSVQEWTAALRADGLVGYLDVEARPQRTIQQWNLDRAGTVLGIVQQDPNTFANYYIPREKLVYVVDDSLNDSPEGLGLLRHVVEPARALRRYEQLEGFGFETDLRGVPMGRAPLALLAQMVENGTLSKESKSAAEQPLRDFIQNHIKNPQLGLLLDSVTYASEDERGTPSNQKQWDMELLKAGNTSQEAVAQAIERKNREMARVLGVESLLLGETSVGSLALSRDKTQNFRLVVDCTLDEIAESFQPDLVDPLFELNGWPEEAKPRLVTSSLPFRDVEQVAKVLQGMAAAGAMLSPEDPAIDEVRAMLGLSKHEVLELVDRQGLGLAPLPPPEEEPAPSGEKGAPE